MDAHLRQTRLQGAVMDLLIAERHLVGALAAAGDSMHEPSGVVLLLERLGELSRANIEALTGYLTKTGDQAAADATPVHAAEEVVSPPPRSASAT